MNTIIGPALVGMSPAEQQQIDDKMGSPEMKQSQGKRSSQFNFLLQNDFNMKPTSKWTNKRDNHQQYVTDLSKGDIRMEQEKAKTI